MPLFQHSVINRYRAGLGKPVLDEAYTRFGGYFLDPQRQRNIRDAKEEQYQEGFLRELFVQVLGYTLNPDPGFNLTTEHRNIKDSRKADGAILSGEAVKAVIELKGTEVTDLTRVESQAFGYKNNQPGCRYVIVSNFEKIRFYIDNAVDHIEFNLFTLTRQEFDLLWLCLSHACLMQDLPARIKEESLSHETEITRALYKDYSLFKREMHQNLTELNPQFDPLTLFKKSQKLLSRLLFLFFAEDRNLLPPNSVRLVLGDWRDLKERDVEVPLYDRFKKYFGYLNTGFKGQRYDVFAYNGGLFKPDLVLDAVRIDDELLYRHTLKLSEYDFISEIDVNILGHIFENSLNELDEIRAQLEGTPVDKAKTKRKKEGVYYTPKYITKYIVENTVGRLCREKREELAIADEEYTDAVRRQTKTRQALLDKLTAYRTWLLQLTICDPACGSGAFLNQALEFLIAEHHAVDELQSRLFGDAMVLSDLDKSILENNLYGVDLNDESVEIARLSLWLRTARPNRTLNDLSANIKVGNSLIDDPAVAGDKAFDWHKEFPHVFAKGGFDVVIGNPPYLRVQGLRENFSKESKYFEKLFKSATGRFDIYLLFIEQGFKLLNCQGLLSFILPHKFINSDFGSGIRKFLLENSALDQLIHFGYHLVFEEASTYTCIILLSHNNHFVRHCMIDPLNLTPFLTFEKTALNQFNSLDKWFFGQNSSVQIIERLSSQTIVLKDVIKHISQGLISVGDDIFLFKGFFEGDYFRGYSERLKDNFTIEKDVVKPILIGEDIRRYQAITNNLFVLYPHFNHEGKTIPYEEEIMELKFPKAYSYLRNFKEELVQKKIRYKTNPKYWYTLHRSREITMFEQKKILTPEISLGTNMTVDDSGFFHNTQVYCIIPSKHSHVTFEYLLALLNSRIFWFFITQTGATLRGGYFRFKTRYLENFPIPPIAVEEQNKYFTENIRRIISTKDQFNKIIGGFHRTLQRHFGLEDIPAKLQHWYQMSYGEFVKELQKKKVKLTLAQEAEWEPHFLAEAAKAQELKRTIDATDREIDRMVYELYGLTEEEIAVVEGRSS